MNEHTYAPPITNHPIIDEAFFHFVLGYICYNCFEEVKWSKEDLKTLGYDWGWEPNREDIDQ